tara:strand:- start:2142 stop:2918 length:777 start_codon:yes stop_codon:yes gene_type:complete
MNKECSFLLIIIISYLSYNYCSQTIEGIDPNVNQGGYNILDQDSVQSDDQATLDSRGIDKDKDKNCDSPKSVCYYKDKDCTNKNNWCPNGSCDEYKFGTSNNQRDNCARCFQSNSSGGSIVNYLSLLGGEAHKSEDGKQGYSNFASNYCDALNADCTSPFWYALGVTDFDNDCGDIGEFPYFGTKKDSNWTSFILCIILRSYPIEFITEILKGVTCELKIKFEQMKQSAEEEVREIKGDISNLGGTIVDGLKKLNPLK